MAIRIFVVDDESSRADTLAEVLRTSEYDVTVLYDTESALKQVDQCCPELIIVYVGMAGMNGLAMAVRIRKHHPDCRTVLFSGRATTMDILEGLQAPLQKINLILVGTPEASGSAGSA